MISLFHWFFYSIYKQLLGGNGNVHYYTEHPKLLIIIG